VRVAVVIALLGIACGGESRSESASVSESVSESESASATPTVAAPEGDPADCDRVRPCAEAFIAVAPADLAATTRVALEQLDDSLAESPARAAACSAALASYRADLERLELDVPEACAQAPHAPPAAAQ